MARHLESILYSAYFYSYDKVPLRYGIWPCGLSPRGSVVLLSGRSEFMEKYEYVIKALNERKWNDFSLGWRGQGLSGRMLPNSFKGFVRDFNDYVRDLAFFMDEIVKPRSRAPRIMLAHSLGGHIALRYLHDHPRIIDKAVLTAPMVDIITEFVPMNLARAITRTALWSGRAGEYAIGQRDYHPNTTDNFKRNPLTSDIDNYLRSARLIEEQPDLALGGVTYGWLQAAFDSIDKLLLPGYAESINTPTLIIQADNDRVVSNAAIKALYERMNAGRIVSIPNARHEILQESPKIRRTFWRFFDVFSKKI